MPPRRPAAGCEPGADCLVFLHMFIRDWHRTIAKAQAWEEKNEPVIQGQRA